MSLLLDALKKSEAQRKRGEIPRFETAQMPEHDAGGFGRLQRWMLVLAFLLVLMVGAALWWLAPAGRNDAGQATRAAAGGAEDTAGAEIAAAPEAAGGPEQGAAPGAAVAEPTGAEPGPASRDDAQPPPQGEAVPAASAPPAMSRTASRPEPAREQPSVRPEQDPAEGAGVTATAAEIADVPGIEEALPAAAATRPTLRTPPEAEPVDWIRPWELPEAERARFPQLRLSVHFYASRPDDRFVLLNGEQVRQGDRIEGVRIAEIHRRGVVVDFGSYRVLIE